MGINWNLVPYFNRYEFDDPNYIGSGDYINGHLLIKLVQLRLETIKINNRHGYKNGWPIITHASVGGAVDVYGFFGHSKKSFHRLDRGASALDFHFGISLNDVCLREQFHLISEIGFGGIGIYYWWNNPGFHVDIRPREKTQYWVSREKGEYTYLI